MFSLRPHVSSILFKTQERIRLSASQFGETPDSSHWATEMELRKWFEKQREQAQRKQDSVRCWMPRGIDSTAMAGEQHHSLLNVFELWRRQVRRMECYWIYSELQCSALLSRTLVSIRRQKKKHTRPKRATRWLGLDREVLIPREVQNPGRLETVAPEVKLTSMKEIVEGLRQK